MAQISPLLAPTFSQAFVLEFCTFVRTFISLYKQKQEAINNVIITLLQILCCMGHSLSLKYGAVPSLIVEILNKVIFCSSSILIRKRKMTLFGALLFCFLFLFIAKVREGKEGASSHTLSMYHRGLNLKSIICKLRPFSLS